MYMSIFLNFVYSFLVWLCFKLKRNTVADQLSTIPSSCKCQTFCFIPFSELLFSSGSLFIGVTICIDKEIFYFRPLTYYYCGCHCRSLCFQQRRSQQFDIFNLCIYQPVIKAQGMDSLFTVLKCLCRNV